MSNNNFGIQDIDNTPSGVYAISRDGVTRLPDQHLKEVSSPGQPAGPVEEQTASALSGFPTPGALLKAFLRSWKLALLLALPVAVTIGFGVWTLRPNKETAQALLQMSQPESLLGEHNYRPSDLTSFTATQIEISLTKWLSLLSQAGGSGVTNFNLRVRKNY